MGIPLLMNPASIYSPHNHLSCIESALNQARARCRANNARLTTLRELVFELVWQSHKPLGAYQLMDLLRERYQGNVAPPTVYRALEFLQEQGLVHRLATLNAYIGCSQLQQRDHQPSFFICQGCGNAMEVNTPRIAQAIREIASLNQFVAQDFNSGGNAVEVTGICNICARQSRAPQQKDLLGA
jgi:Fur family zinc uptake transcriptional regulator